MVETRKPRSGEILRKSGGKKPKPSKPSISRMQEWVQQVKEWGEKTDWNLNCSIQALYKPGENRETRKIMGKRNF